MCVRACVCVCIRRTVDLLVVMWKRKLQWQQLTAMTCMSAYALGSTWYHSLNLFLIQLNGVLIQRCRDIEVSLKGFQSKTTYPFGNCSWRRELSFPLEISADISLVTNAVS